MIKLSQSSLYVIVLRERFYILPKNYQKTICWEFPFFRTCIQTVQTESQDKIASVSLRMLRQVSYYYSMHLISFVEIFSAR